MDTVTERAMENIERSQREDIGAMMQQMKELHENQA